MPFLVFIMTWPGKHRAFVVKEFIKMAVYRSLTQHMFHILSALSRHDPVPDIKTIENWVLNFRKTNSDLKIKPIDRPRTATGLENVAAVKAF